MTSPEDGLEGRTASLDTAFAKRTPRRFGPEAVSRGTLEAVWELARWGPTSFNGQPLRILWAQSPAARQALVSTVWPGNAENLIVAPAVALLSADRNFHLDLSKYFPWIPDLNLEFDVNKERAIRVSNLSAHLQTGYFILAARSIGLDVFPIEGFDPHAARAAFQLEPRFEPFLILAVGYGDGTAYLERGARRPVAEVMEWR